MCKHYVNCVNCVMCNRFPLTVSSYSCFILITWPTQYVYVCSYFQIDSFDNTEVMENNMSVKGLE